MFLMSNLYLERFRWLGLYLEDSRAVVEVKPSWATATPTLLKGASQGMSEEEEEGAHSTFGWPPV